MSHVISSKIWSNRFEIEIYNPSYTLLVTVILNLPLTES